jgi:hypothetical protein
LPWVLPQKMMRTGRILGWPPPNTRYEREPPRSDATGVITLGLMPMAAIQMAFFISG